MTDDLAAMPTMHCTIESRSCLPAPPAYQHSLLRHLQHQLRRTSRGKVDNSNLPTTASSRVSSTSEAATTAALLEAAQRQKGFGASSTQAERQEVLQLVAELKEELHTATQADAIDPTQGPVAGRWQLLWTTEASVHGIVNGQLLGAPVTDIQQDIDLQSQRVTNTISFGWLGLQLQASGPLTVLSSSRIYYSFDRLSLKVLQLKPFPLPTVKGGGWTDCVLLLEDGSLRVMENSRRDTLLLRRVEEGNVV